MELTDIKGLTGSVRETLAREGWSVRGLCTASKGQLVKYPGIGEKTAGRIIAEARRLVGEQAMVEAGLFPPEPLPEEEVKAHIAAKLGAMGEPVAQRSVRVQRILDQQEGQ